MSTFGTLNTGISGLLAAQRAMDTASQNVANANTPGYSRQRVQLSSVGAPVAASYHTGSSIPLGGVRVEDVTRVRDAFLEATRAAAGGRQQFLTARESTLSGAELLMSEPGTTGLQAGLDTFYAAWQELSLNPTDSAAGSVVLQTGQAVADQLHAVGSGISARWADSHAELNQVVTQVNRAAANLAELNGRILEGSAVGRPVNELLDQRDTLVRSLADLVGGYAVPGDDGAVSVSVNGITIVAGTQAQTLELSGATDIDNVATDPPTITWAGGPVSVESGAAAGYLAALRTDLPDLLGGLDQVAVALRDAVNSIHTTGFTLDGDPGGDFFAGTGSRDLSIVPTGPDQLAMTSAAGTVDGAVALRIGDLADDVASSAALGGGDGASARWRSLTTDLGTKVQSLRSSQAVQESVVSAADDAVNSDSGVSLDEEMTAIIQFQRAYQASARVITTIDEMLDTLVNRTGAVGR
jgi:flagellar hook-associated protein 1 FlgK